jgi:hypothetical protein
MQTEGRGEKKHPTPHTPLIFFFWTREFLNLSGLPSSTLQKYRRTEIFKVKRVDATWRHDLKLQPCFQESCLLNNVFQNAA